MPDITRIEKAVVDLERKLKTLTDPADIARTTGNIEKLKAKLGTQQYQTYSPPVESVSPLSQPSDSVRNPVEGGSKFWYEPTAEDVRSQLSSDPKLAQRLNLQSWTSSPDQLDSINESSTAFKAVADDKFNRDQEEARLRGVNLDRYKDVSVAKNPFDYISGGIGKYAPDVVHGTATAFGMPSSQRMDSQLDDINQQLGLEADAEQPIPGTVGTVKHPGVETAAQIAASFAPSSLGNVAAKSITDLGKYATRGVLGKAAVAAGAGAGTANVEGIASDVNTGFDEGKSWEDVARQSLEASPLRSGIGAIVGGAADLGGQVAGKVAKSRAIGDQDLKLLREAGGETDTIRGVVAPQSIKDNINAHYEGRTGEVGYPEDIAAGKVAPQIKESLINETSAERDRIGQETEAYLNHPAVRDQKESMKGLAENVIGMFQKGAFEAPLTGDLSHVNPEAVNTFKKLLASIGEVKYVTPEESMMFARQSDGIVLDGRHMRGLGIEEQAGKVPVYVPAKTNARSLLDMEEMIDEKLKMAGTPGGINNPIWKRVNQSVKSIRDRFGVEQPQPNNLGPTFAPAADIPQPPAIGVHQRPTDVTGPTAPEAIPGIGPEAVRVPGEPANPFSPYSPYQPPIDVQAQNPVGVNLPRPPESQSGLGPGQRFDPPGVPRGIDAITPQRPIVVGNQSSRPTVQPEAQQGMVLAQDVHSGSLESASPSSSGYEDITPSQMERPTGVDLGPSNTPELSDYQKMINAEIEMSKFGRAATQMPPNGIAVERGTKMAQMPIEERIKFNDDVSSINREFEEGLNRDVRTRENERLKGWTDVAEEQSPQSFYDRVMGKTSNPTEPVDLGESAAPEAFSSAPPSDTVIQPSVKPPPLPTDDMGKRSAAAAYPEESLAPNNGQYDISQIKDQVAESGGVDSAGRLNKGMREDSLQRESSKYTGKQPNEVAANLEFPIDVQIDAGNMMLRDGRHRLEAAKKAGATVINTRVRIIDENGKAVEAGVLPLPIYPNGLPKEVIADATKNPPKYTAELEDGTVVHGLSALRRQQHLAQQKLDELVNKTGTGRDVVAQRVIGFGSGPGQAAQDAALLEQAKKLGLEKELRETAGTAAYQRLLHRLKLSSAKGPWSGVVDFFGTRIDPAMRAMAGQAPNPFIPAPTSPAGRIQQYLFETQPKNALNLTRGLPAARSAPYLEEHYKDKDKKK